MNKYIGKEHRQMIYKDESGDNFLLTKRCEVYEYGKDDLRVLTWTMPARHILNQNALFTEVDQFDDNQTIFKTSVEGLKYILGQWGYKNRIQKEGKNRKRLVSMLGHEIIDYRPINLYGVE